MQKKLFAVAIFLVTVFCAVNAQEKKSLLADTIAINEVIVTSSRYPVSIKDVPQSVQIFNSKAIENSNSVDLTTFLKQNANIDLVEYPGMLSGVSMRGFQPKMDGLNQKVLMLVDGRPAAATNISMIDTKNVERIEIIKGPASALYGPQAMGGVINIITKKSTQKIGGTASVSYGSFNQSSVDVAAGGGINEKLSFDLTVSRFQRNTNFRMGKNNMLRGIFDGDMLKNNFSKGDSSNFENMNFGDGQIRDYSRYTKYFTSLRGGYKISKNWEMSVMIDGLLADNVENPGDIKDGNKKPSSKDIGKFSGHYDLSGWISKNNYLNMKLFYGQQVSEDIDLYEGWDKPVFIEPFKSFQEKYTWKGFNVKDVVELKNHKIIFGIDYNNGSYKTQRFDKTGKEIAPYNPDYGIVSTGIYTQANFSFFNKKLNTFLGVRYDNIKYDIFKTELINNQSNIENNQIFSPSLGVQFKLSKLFSLNSTFGKGFSPADVYQVAGYSETADWFKMKHVTVTKGNPNLKNMESNTFDISLKMNERYKGFLFEITYFNTKYKNNGIQVIEATKSLQLTAAGDTIDAIASYINADKSLINGIETAVSFDFGSFSNNSYSLLLYANLNKFFNKKEEADEYMVGKIKRQVYYVADESVRFGIRYDNHKNFNVGVSGRYSGHRFDRNWDYWDSYVESRYPRFMVLDFDISFTVLKHHTISLFLNNLTDENYFEKRGFNMPGRSLMMKYGFKF